MEHFAIRTPRCQFVSSLNTSTYRLPSWWQCNNDKTRHQHPVTLIELNSLTDPAGPDLSDYTSLTDVALRTSMEAEHGLYIAESSNVIRRAIQAGHRVRSMLLAPRYLESCADILEALDPQTPVYVAPESVLEDLTGFHLHRGAIAAMHRPRLDQPDELLHRICEQRRSVRVAIFEDIVDHTNLGAAFRAAAALKIDAVFITPRCADPFYRRSVRVSMGAVFQVPWTRLSAWPHARRERQDSSLARAHIAFAHHGPRPVTPTEPAGIELLRSYGFTTAALALTESAMTLDELERNLPERLALVLGNEGHGLRPGTIAACDFAVRIPMAEIVDSLNVASAAAVAFWATRIR